MARRGKYIVIEGLDGSGKSTQHQRLLAHFGPKAIGVREPGGSPMSEAIRNLVKDGGVPRASRTNNYLFAAARVELVDHTIRPALEKGQHVLADRNWLSSIAYQGAEGVQTEEIVAVNRLAMEELFIPDLVIFLDTSVATSRKRLQSRGDDKGDYFEKRGEEYFYEVRRIYLAHLEKLPHYYVIDGNQSTDEVAQQILHLLPGRNLHSSAQ